MFLWLLSSLGWIVTLCQPNKTILICESSEHFTNANVRLKKTKQADGMSLSLRTRKRLNYQMCSGFYFCEHQNNYITKEPQKKKKKEVTDVMKTLKTEKRKWSSAEDADTRLEHSLQTEGGHAVFCHLCLWWFVSTSEKRWINKASWSQTDIHG